jgi:hypothetical protein
LEFWKVAKITPRDIRFVPPLVCKSLKTDRLPEESNKTITKERASVVVILLHPYSSALSSAVLAVYLLLSIIQTYLHPENFPHA